MMMISNLEVLKQYPLLHSSDYRQIKTEISRYLCPHQFSVLNSEDLDTQLNGIFFGKISLFDLSYSAPVEIQFGAESDFYLFRFNLEGQCKVEYEQCIYAQIPGVLTISHPYTENKVVLDTHCRNIILKIKQELVNQVLYRLLGFVPQDKLLFDSGVNYTSEECIAILETLNYLCFAYSNIDNWWQVSESFSQYLVELLLIKIPNNFSEQISKQKKLLIPSYIKKAVNFIEVNHGQPITILEIAQAADVSVRTLQKGFNLYLHQTPLNYIASIRLEQIHHALNHCALSESVTEIMLKHGVRSFGHFTRLYKKRFGCLPSETLKNKIA